MQLSATAASRQEQRDASATVSARWCHPHRVLGYDGAAASWAEALDAVEEHGTVHPSLETFAVAIDGDPLTAASLGLRVRPEASAPVAAGTLLAVCDLKGKPTLNQFEACTCMKAKTSHVALCQRPSRQLLCERATAIMAAPFFPARRLAGGFSCAARARSDHSESAAPVRVTSSILLAHNAGSRDET